MKKSSTPKKQSKTEIALNESEQRYRTTMMSVGSGGKSDWELLRYPSQETGAVDSRETIS
jgi:hypothetical protein